MQGVAAEAGFYILTGKIKLVRRFAAGQRSPRRHTGAGSLFGEGCLAGQLAYMAAATAMEDSNLVRIDKKVMIRLLHDDPIFSELFLEHLLSRNKQIQEDLVDQLFNSAEKRLARVLLIMAHFGKDGKPEPVIAMGSQETLAGMIGAIDPSLGPVRRRYAFMSHH